MIINGTNIKNNILEQLNEEVRKNNLNLKLVAVLVGGNSGLLKFVELKEKAARKIGAGFDLYRFPETISEKRLISQIKKITDRNDTTGLLIELPLPEKFNKQKVLNAVPAEKDVDILSQEAQNKFFSGDFSVLPPAVEAVKTVLEFYNYSIKGRKVAVFGYGLLVGKPVAYWLEQNGAKVSVIDENTGNPEKYSVEADIIISGVGKPGLIRGNMVKDGVVAIDFGYENKNGRIVGDFTFNEIAPKASLITPVPGGMGPVVVAAVLKNLVKLIS